MRFRYAVLFFLTLIWVFLVLAFGVSVVFALVGLHAIPWIRFLIEFAIIGGLLLIVFAADDM